MRFPSIKPAALFLLAALPFAQPAFATAYIRFANASLQGQPATDKVQIKLDGVTLVDALGYKGATGYFDVDSGAPFLTVWFQGSKIVDRQLDIRDDRSYHFVVVGNGTSDPFNVYAEYEPLLVLDENMTEFSDAMVAPYPGRPHADERPLRHLMQKKTCRSAPNSTNSSGGTFRYPSAQFPPNFEADKFIDPSTFFVPGVPVPVGSCRVEVLAPAPNGMDPSFAIYTPANGSYISQILVGDGISAPIEWWVVQQRARFVEPAPVRTGSWAAGIWVAPSIPGLAVALDVENHSHPALLRAEQQLDGILFGFDRLGQTRWYRLGQAYPALGGDTISFDPSEYLTNVAGEINERAPPTALQIKFLTCDRARLTLSSIYMLRTLDIVALGQAYRPIELERVTPLAENCPR